MKQLFFFYFFLFGVLAILSYGFIDPHFFPLRILFNEFAFKERLLATAVYMLCVTGVIATYLFLLKHSSQIEKGVLQRLIINKIAIVIFILLLAYPSMLSYDIFNYLTTAKVMFFYQENPYVVMPIEFVGDENLQFTHSANKTALYGPLWILLTGIPFLLSNGNILLSLLLMKMLVSLFFIATLFVIYRMTNSILSVVIFGLHPLVLIETVLSGHNDIVMMFFVLLSYYLFLRKKIFLAVLCFFASVLIKYVTISLFPVVVFLTVQLLFHRKIPYQKVYLVSGCIMLGVFFFSFLREEIYSWYAIWFLSFVALVPRYRYFFILCIAISCGLLYKYIPFMYLGTHSGVVPVLKYIALFLFVIPGFFFDVLSNFHGKNDNVFDNSNSTCILCITAAFSQRTSSNP